jgi:hypothetical protein
MAAATIYQHGQMQPLYEAMAVGSYTINWLERQELERDDFELQFNLAKLASAMEDFIEQSRKNPLRDAEQDRIELTSALVFILGDIIQAVVTQTRGRLPEVCAHLQQTIGLLVNQIEGLSERIADIAEAWEICLDQELSSKLSLAVQSIDRDKDSEDIPDWRTTPELVQD